MQSTQGWKATRTLTITYGLRSKYNAAPSSPNGTLPFTMTEVDNLPTMTLAPPGTPLWHSQLDDLAPRFGLASQPLANLVPRAGPASSTTSDTPTSRMEPAHSRSPEKDDSKYLVPAERCQGRAASFHDDSSCCVPCGGRPESRITQNV